MKKVININTNGSHYLIHVFYNDLSSQDIHVYTKAELDKKINELWNNKEVYDFYIYLGLDFDVVEDN